MTVRSRTSRISKNLFGMMFMIALGAAITGWSAVPASACSAEVIGARRLAAMADTVVLARVIGNEVRGRSALPVMEVIEVFKGAAGGDTFTISGTAVYRDAPETEPARIYPRAEVPYDFHPESARLASCYTERYLLHGYYLLFLKNGTIRWAAMAATNARVSGRDDAWVAWVREEFRRKQ